MRLELEGGYSVSDLVPSDRSAMLTHLREREIYDHTLNIPYPYKESDADRWFARAAEETRVHGRSINWAIRAPDGAYVGGIGFHGLEVGRSHRAEIGYWLAKPYWNRGLGTAAVQRVAAFGFDDFGFVRVTGTVFHFNARSARVLEKAGFAFEGRLRNYYKKDGEIFDGLLYARVRELLREGNVSSAPEKR
ncbi:MAG TPA: GNAT family N-acetyltransferase [Polyangiaceae bacterium]|jgi:ribosomal-protein-alanine N-acetyltransferase|nr:GNAT family N-acetyltransferase [Polyangiaceae bacterium]